MREPDPPRVTGALVPPAATAEPWTSEICRLVNERYHQLGAFQTQLEDNAKRLRRTGRLLKGSLIVLGALSATKATADAAGYRDLRHSWSTHHNHGRPQRGIQT
jgi:hypothetical protein